MFIDQLPTMTHNDPESSFGWEMLEKQTCKMQTIDVFDHATKTALFWEGQNACISYALSMPFFQNACFSQNLV